MVGVRAITDSADDSTVSTKSLPNIIVVDQRLVSSHTYLRYLYIIGTTLFSVSGAIKIVWIHSASLAFTTILYSTMLVTHILACSADQRKNKENAQMSQLFKENNGSRVI